MTNTNITKRALLSSAVAVFLCFAMLLGTTFAWFTDSVTSGSNVIQTGTLAVDLVDANGNSMEGEIIEFVTADGRAQGEILWEPGCTYKTEPVYVVNKGTLDLKYEIIINGIVGNAKLLDAIEWTVTVDGTTTALDALNGTLPAGEKSGAIVITGHMKEDAGNEYQNLVAEGISISVIATQKDAEKDSIDNQYDALATYINKNANGAWEIGNIGQLIYFAKTVNEGTKDYAGETVVLTNDIDLAGINWAPIGNWDSSFAGAFDGQGYTISNMTINAPEGDGVGFFGVTETTTIENVNFENVDILGNTMVATVAGFANTGSVISNCHVSGDISIVAEYAYAAGISAGQSSYSVDNCSVIADGTGVIIAKEKNAVGGITAWIVSSGDYKITDCQVKNLDLVGWTNIGGISGLVSAGNTVDGCTVENVTITKTRLEGHPGVGAISGGFTYKDDMAINLTNNTIKNVSVNGTAIYRESASCIYGSEYSGTDKSNFVLSGTTDASEITNNIVYITIAKTADELAAAVANGGYIVLGSNIALDDSSIKIEKGNTVVLDLNGKTITGSESATGSFGLFTNTGNFTIKDSAGSGKITLTATNNRGWNAYSSVISNTVGGKFTLESGVIEHLGGTDMAYAIDNLTNGKGTYAEVVINGGTVKSTYRAVRMFLNGIEAQNLLTVNGGVIEGANKSIWMQDPSKNANTGALVVNEGATLIGNAYLTVTAGSTEWPVSASINAKALSNGAEVLTSNVPAGYEVKLVDGCYVVATN